MMKLSLTLFAVLAAVTSGFSPLATSRAIGVSSSSTALAMANDDDLLRWARSSRSASNEDNVVELLRPLGLVLQEDENRNVYVETVAPKGNAARTGQVCIINVGTIIAFQQGNRLCFSPVGSIRIVTRVSLLSFGYNSF